MNQVRDLPVSQLQDYETVNHSYQQPITGYENLCRYKNRNIMFYVRSIWSVLTHEPIRFFKIKMTN